MYRYFFFFYLGKGCMYIVFFLVRKEKRRENKILIVNI